MIRFSSRLQEIDMFFNRKSPVHKTMSRLARRLAKAKIPFAIMGGMAVNAHGAERTTKDVDILMAPEGLQRFRDEFVGGPYETVPGRARRFMEVQSGVTVDVLVTGSFPGSGKPGPVAFPDPGEVSEVIDRLPIISLPHLIQLKLAARRYYDFGDVVSLIRVHNLDESFADKLHPTLRADYIECLEEKCREDEYESRQ
jgi:hypothetical protein